MRRFSVSAAMLCVLSLTTTLTGHETWLLPASFTAPVDRPVTIDLTSGMGFPKLDHSIRKDRVVRASFRLGAAQTAIKSLEQMEKSLQLAPSFPRQGLATVWIELHPRTIDLPNEKVGPYLDEIGASNEIRAAWARLQGKVGWKETYTKHAKTFIAVGDARADRSWREPVGMGLEIVPTTDPQDLRVGKTASFVLLARGRPLVDTSVGLQPEGSEERVFRKTDAAGRISFPLEKAGKTLIYAVNLKLMKDGATWESDFTTLTVPVHGN